jgi:undecaprenyl-diphosphatase
MGPARVHLRLAAGAAGLFLVIAATALGGLWSGIDAAAARTVGDAAASHPGTLAVWRAVSAWHAPQGIVLCTAVGVVVLLLRRRVLAAAGFAVAVFGGATWIHVVKHTLRRPRPGLVEAAGAATDFAFPSGHVANATLLYGAFVVVLWPALGARGRACALVMAAAVVAAIGVSRVALGAHRLSDVLAGPPLALAWLAACLWTVAMWRAHGSRSKQDGPRRSTEPAG